MTMPNFLIIGAAKSGTTSVYNYLRQHPQVYMSPLKETNFFAYEGQELDFRWWGKAPTSVLNSITDIDSYRAQFREVSQEIAIGEASPLYLYHPTAPVRIKNYLPNVKLIAFLRHPAERAFSHFRHLIRENREPTSSFSQALEQETLRMRANWNWDYFYRDLGFYYAQLQRYYDIFDRDQIKIFLFSELKSDPRKVIEQIFRFLGVDHTFVPDVSTKHNISGIPKNMLIKALLSNYNPIKIVIRNILPRELLVSFYSRIGDKLFVKPELPLEIRAQLTDEYKKDIKKLQNLVDKDLSIWLE